ncbi:hypothetical protein QT969_10380 [Rhodococcus sp. CSLK01-03]|uniref:LtfC/p132/Gp6 beta-sandwich domain-containing protein n=1 Tax=Rhodococcus indonesiensis TaxID=3055869 RepID=A0ABT7RM51_9NOCA|nr:hypothetical protein [Rhodococcus indonesiensis]MDM7488697.1 hypothetical protein [Rhodococcus indonesiensis]
MTAALGRTPEQIKLILSLGADFTQIIKTPENETFPVDTVVAIRFYDDPADTAHIAEWLGDVTSTQVEWRIESALADVIPDRTPFRMYVSYPEVPTLEHCWFTGRVARKQ